MGRPKSRQAPRTTMSIRVSERERREIEEKAAATGMTPSAYIHWMVEMWIRPVMRTGRS